MRAILKEVQHEVCSGRLLDPKYYGVVFAHEDDHNDIIDLITYTISGNMKENHKEFIASSGARLCIIDEGNHIEKWLHNHGGAHYTTVILSKNMLVDKEFNSRIPDVQKFIMYMNSRLRAVADLHTRMVIC